jgi:hypothetical protein
MTTVDFFKSDFQATLFPLKTNLFMVESHSVEISKYINEKILKEDVESDNFLSQQKVYATKPRGHLRRTVKLDPVAEYFIYDLVYRNRAIFRPEVSVARRSFGYRFKDGSHIPVHVAYREYKDALTEGESKHKHKMKKSQPWIPMLLGNTFGRLIPGEALIFCLKEFTRARC